MECTLKISNQGLADYYHPKVQERALALTESEPLLAGKIKKIFNFVRDEIKFGFPPDGDFTCASKTLEIGIGQCNTKGTLFLALCKAVDIPARIHFSLIKREIQRGIFPHFLYILLPKKLSHSWIEIKLDQKWKRIDGYIDDLIYFRGAIDKLSKNKWDIGYSVAIDPEEKFEQMAAVIEDHGIWDDPLDYYQSSHYRNKPNQFKKYLYHLTLPWINSRINKIRHSQI